jgi:hypothetical protein
MALPCPPGETEVLAVQAIHNLFEIQAISPLKSLAYRNESLAKRARDRDRVPVLSQSAR